MQTVMTNIHSENAQRQLMKTSSKLQTTMQRLASGLRINSAKDDAAGLQISNRMGTQIGGLAVAMRNASDGISLAQTAEGAMEEMSSILLRMRELAMQAMNGTYGTDDRVALNNEYQQLVSELSRTVSSTEFNEQAILATTASFEIAVDYKDGSNNITVSIADLSLASNADSGVPNDGSGTTGDILSEANAALELARVDVAVGNVDAERAKLGAYQSRLQSTINNLASIKENLTASRSRIMDTDFAVETANLSKYQILQQAGNTILNRANSLPQNVLLLLQNNG